MHTIKRPETPKARHAYEIYRDLGPERSQHAVALQLGSARQHIGIWSVQHTWVARATEWDRGNAEAADRYAKIERVREIEKRRKQREGVAVLVRSKGVEALKLMTAKGLATKPYAVVQMLDYADKSERLDMGEATERSEISGPDGQAIGITNGREPINPASVADVLAILSRAGALPSLSGSSDLLSPGTDSPADSVPADRD